MNDCDRCSLSLIPYFQYGLNVSALWVIQWSSIPYLVEKKALGTAYGIISCLDNLLLTIALPLIGWIQQKTIAKHGYWYVCLTFLIMSYSSLFVKIIFFQWEK